MDPSTPIPPHQEDDASKKTSGLLETFRNNIRLAAEKSPLTPGSRGSKNRSPSTPDRAPHSPGVTSPPRSAAARLRTKDGDDDHDQSPKSRAVMHSRTEPNLARLDSLLKKGASIRRSLRFSSKKGKRQDALLAVQGEAKEEDEDEEGEEDDGEAEAWEEMEEAYTLPELPHVPLSVMQISKLIEMEVLEEAHLHLLALRAEFQRERLGLDREDSTVELAKKEKDLSLLYADLRLKIAGIVRTSVSLPARNKGLLVHVARIVQEEDKRAREAGGLHGSWMDAWREAVEQGAREKVDAVHLEPTNQSNASWLAVHLGLLGKAVVEDLEKVKRELRRSYPPSFRVFATYVRSYHAAVGRHLRVLEGRAAQLKDLYALLDWMVHRYRSERLMASPALEPDMSHVDIDLRLDQDLLLRLRDKFCRTVKEDMRVALDRLVALENEEMWSVRKHPDTDDDHLLTSMFHMDICTKVSGNVVNARLVDADLERGVVASCLGELQDFPKRFHAEFRRQLSSLPADEPLWSEFQVTYINCFHALQRHIDDSYASANPHGVEAVRKEVTWLLRTLREGLELQFKGDVKLYLRRMMTRKWLTNDDDFSGLHARAELLARHCEAMRPPHRQDVAGAAHYHVLKEYVGQLMKTNYSCKKRKHHKAAGKMRAQCSELADLFHRMGSQEDWLDPVGDYLSDIVGQKNEGDIKDHLQPLLDQYPDFSSRHLTAVLAFRGVLRGREHQRILRRLDQLRKTKITTATGNDHHGRRSLFRNMEAPLRADCLSDVSSFCFTFVFPGE
ncbi:exocyst complex component 3-like protein 4 [Hippocampus comes]|uniref:Exocyst complex component 3 like 4 n=1 Tax=Hippocampus comes TaxID=109280 RepID=A0A3Q2X7T7_HIPCM|nr:PREDICTED: exocyst complex component 3-like protein 4 [Hippocampus comes]XP_019734269.1 PREDICTED: exocyst complex component 3-like protein 4 [Hippocampus comes]